MTMPLSRRSLIGAGCLLAAGLRPAHAADIFSIAMRGNENGSRVWFEPVGLHVPPGSVIRWTNRDPGNAHSSTAYHPQNMDHTLRMPLDAEPWNSDYLLPDQFFETRLTVEGVYDYFCMPHEHAGMAGRVIVGQPPKTGFWTAPDLGLPEPVAATLPAVETIIRQGRVERPVQF